MSIMPPLRPRLRNTALASLIALVLNSAAPTLQAHESEASTTDPTASTPASLPSGSGGIGFVVDKAKAEPSRGSPQPNIRHATARYEATFVGSANQAALFAVLDKPLPGGGLPEFNESPLRGVVTEIVKAVGVPVQIDSRALEDSGLDLDTPFTCGPLKNISLGAGLKTIFDGCGLTVTIQDETLIVTTKEKAEEHFIVGVYPVPFHDRCGTLIDTIQSTVAVDYWDVVGGQGAIRFVPEANALVISQTLDVHMDIVNFMRATFEEDFGVGPDNATDRLPVRVYHLRNPKLANTTVPDLAELCNSALGKAGDPEAKVSLIGDACIVVQSASRPFHVYAAELIRSLDAPISP